MLNIKKLLTKMLRATLKTGTQQFSGSWTIGSNGYVQLGPLPTTNGIVYSAIVSTWGSNTGAFSLVLSGNTAYLIGNSGTVVVNPTIKYLYYEV